MKINKQWPLGMGLLLLSGYLFAQPLKVAPENNSAKNDSAFSAKVYRMHPKYQLPVGGAAIVLSTLGFHALDEKARLTATDVMNLQVNDINAFDRPTALLDPSGFAGNAKKGDFLLNFSVLSPLLLGLDKRMRKDWVDLLTLYLATQAVDNLLYFTAIASIRRPRPNAYNTALSITDRTGVGMSKSFFSGHVSFSATATFFAVKTLTDYHHIKGWPRVLLYGAASIPPLLVAYYRVSAGKHFKTDVITGFICGAASGILVPELFRKKEKGNPKAVSLLPYYQQEGGGVSLLVKL